MADIAMLVAEEYERRVKSSRKSGGGGEEIDLFSVLGQRVDETCSLIRRKFDEGKIEVAKLVVDVEPRSQIGLAAINCFFSA